MLLLSGLESTKIAYWVTIAPPSRYKNRSVLISCRRIPYTVFLSLCTTTKKQYGSEKLETNHYPWHHLLPPARQPITSFHLQICDDGDLPTKGEGAGAPGQTGSLVVTINVPNTSQCFLATERKGSGRGNYNPRCAPWHWAVPERLGLVGLPLSTRSSSHLSTIGTSRRHSALATATMQNEILKTNIKAKKDGQQVHIFNTLLHFFQVISN